MPEAHLSLAAHLLLWGFPLTLVVLVVAELVRESLAAGRRR
jgi:hypothetical protein